MSFSLSGAALFMLFVFVIAALGYLLGAISVKGVALGTAGVFVVALLFGAFFPDKMDTSWLKVVENMGLILFVTAVGFIAGPTFFGNLKRNFKSYVLLGIVIIASGALAAYICLLIGRAQAADAQELSAIMAGLLSGALTSTPAFSAAKAAAAADYESAVTVGYGIAYLFGVVGVVLFVQIVPKFSRANMTEELEKLRSVNTASKKPFDGKLVNIDSFGIMPFALAAVVGVLIGSVKVAHFFSLTTTGGTLITALVMGHVSHVGRLSIMPKESTLKVFREFGLMLFLTGAGVAGGMNFVKYFKPVYFFYGVFMTLLPMLVGYIFAKYVLKLPLLNNLGSITGGMTSTPALGTLIHVAGTEEVASAYAATYPVALILVVFATQIIVGLY